MKAPANRTKSWTLLQGGCVFAWLVVLAAVASGCISPQAESDLRWKQYNPTWKSPLREDGSAQWGPFAPL